MLRQSQLVLFVARETNLRARTVTRMLMLRLKLTFG